MRDVRQESFLLRQKREIRLYWVRVCCWLAAAIAFVTLDLLILPALTMGSSPNYTTAANASAANATASNADESNATASNADESNAAASDATNSNAMDADAAEPASPSNAEENVLADVREYVWMEMTAEELFLSWGDFSPHERYEAIGSLKTFRKEVYQELNELRFPELENSLREEVAEYADMMEILPLEKMMNFLQAEERLEWAWAAIPLDSHEHPESEMGVYEKAETELAAEWKNYHPDIVSFLDPKQDGDEESLRQAVNHVLLNMIYGYYETADLFDDEEGFRKYLDEHSLVSADEGEAFWKYAAVENQVYAAADIPDAQVVGANTPDIRVNLFNYGSNIQSVGPLAFQALGPSAIYFNDVEVDLCEPYDRNQGNPVFQTLKKTVETNGVTELTDDPKEGYPYVDHFYSADWQALDDPYHGAGSWQYLFDRETGYFLAGTDRYGNEGTDIGDYTLQETNYAVRGFPVDPEELYLFQYDEKKNRYVYDSRFNAAFYDEEEQSLKSYNYALRAFKISNNASGQGAFLPFNTVENNSNSIIRLTDENGIAMELSSEVLSTGITQVADAELIATTELMALAPNLYALYGSNTRADLAFGMSVEFDFIMPKEGLINEEPMIFDFRGDDDMVVFLDGYPVLNLGGPRSATRGTIDFCSGDVSVFVREDGWGASVDGIPVAENVLAADVSDSMNDPDLSEDSVAIGRNTALADVFGWEGKVTFEPYSKHTLKLYYLERWGDASNCYLNFNIPVLPEKSLTVTKELIFEDFDETNAYCKNDILYAFRVMRTGANGESTDEVYIPPGTIYELMENGMKTGETGTVSDSGEFYLKADQSAVFDNMLDLAVDEYGGETGYVVQEIIPAAQWEQYSAVECAVNGRIAGVTDTEAGTDRIVSSAQVSADETNTVVFRNYADMSKDSTLTITKEKAPSSDFSEEELFPIQVVLGGQLLEAGRPYTVIRDAGETVETKSECVVEEGLILLRIGETAVIDNLLSGTPYFVSELSGIESKNAALGKSVTAAREANGTEAELIVDGNKDDSGEHWDGGLLPTGFTIDLGMDYSIHTMNAYPYWKQWNWENDRYYRYTIEARPENSAEEDYVTIAEKDSEEYTGSEGHVHTFDSEVKARYIRVTLTDNSENSYGHMVEFEVYGKPADLSETSYNASYKVSYKGSLEAENETQVSVSGIAGELPMSGSAEIVITNADYDFKLEVPICKQAIGNEESVNFQFVAEPVEYDENSKEWITAGEPMETSVTAEGDVMQNGELTIGYETGQNGVFCYRVREIAEEERFLYDDTYYIIEVKVADGCAEIQRILKNGTEVIDTTEALSFINYRLLDLSVQKTISGTDDGLRFPFIVTAELEGKRYPLNQEEGAEYEIEDGAAVFELGDNECIKICNLPYGAVVRVKELDHTGYISSCKIGNEEEAAFTDMAVIENLTTEMSVQFINTVGYELPKTGGRGNECFILGGTAVLILSGLCGLSIKYKREFLRRTFVRKLWREKGICYEKIKDCCDVYDGCDDGCNGDDFCGRSSE